MKNLNSIILFITLIISNISIAQCGHHSEVISMNINEVNFWDDMNGFGIGGSKLAITNDGGNTWRDYKLPDFQTRFNLPLVEATIINSNSAIIVGFNGHILLTNDRGVTWKYKSVRLDGRESLATVHFVNDSLGYIGGFNYGETELVFYKTTDGGNNWVRINSNLTTNILTFGTIERKTFKFHFINQNIGFLWKRNSLFKTINGGITWNEITNPSPDYIIKIKSSSNNKIVLSSKNLKLYYSDDIGLTWNVFSQVDCATNQCLTNGQFDIKDNKLISQVGYIIDSTKIIKINLLTNATELINIENDIGYITDFNYYETNKYAFVGCGFNYTSFGRKIVRTINDGLTFETLDSFNSKSLSTTGTNNGLTLLRNGPDILTASVNDLANRTSTTADGLFLHVSKDNGNSWRQIAKETPNQGKLLYVNNSYISYVYSASGSSAVTLKESNNYGATWTSSTFTFPENTTGFIMFFTAIDQNTFIFKYFGNYYYTTNKGQTWTFFNLPVMPNGTFYEYKFKSLNEIYAWGKKNNWPTVYDYFLYKSTNLGQSWSQVVTIPDNNGADMGAIAGSTFFYNNFAIVSTGGNTYFKVNLTNNTFTPHPFTNPTGRVYLAQEELFFLNENNWIMLGEWDGYEDLEVTKNQGLTWEHRFCQVCGNNWLYDATNNEIIAYKNYDLQIERLQDYIPSVPVIFGNMNPSINTTEDYFIPFDPFADEVTWEVLSGGQLILNPNTQSYRAKVNWTQNGQHILRAKRTNTCGESSYTLLTIQIGPLNTNENNYISSVIVSPNPFKEKINIQIKDDFEPKKFELYDSLGKKVLTLKPVYNENNIIIDNLQDLPVGIYYLNIFENNDKYYISKLIKE